jgi:pyruvate,water dikinase
MLMCTSSRKLLFWFEEIGEEHTDAVGKKCANLGAMSRMGFPVPSGFAISIEAYKRFIEETGAVEEMHHYISRLGELKALKQFEEASEAIRDIIEARTMPKGMEEEITSYYGNLCNRLETRDAPVSVRSAGTVSRPGMFETYLNVNGGQELLDKVKRVWASAFTPRAIAFRVSKQIPVDGDMLGVAVCEMIDARSAGVGFTADPVSGNTSKIVIEANWGLGESVVSGTENVDKYVVDKRTLEIKERLVGNKARRVINKKKGVDYEDVPPDMRLTPCLDDGEIQEVATIAKTLEERFGCPQDVEWAIKPDLPLHQSVFLLQSRPAKIAVKKSETVSDRVIDLILERFYER